MNDFLTDITRRLSVEGIDSPRLEARLMLAHILNCPVENLSSAEIVLSSSLRQKLDSLIEKRLAHSPLDKLLGEKGFYKYDFIVNENVLSPRPDTEILVEAAIKAAGKIDSPRILDLGTGSGCIILSVLGDVNTAQGVAVDVSQKALDVAAANAERLGLSKRLKLIRASWFDEDLAAKIEPPFDIIVSNPPYIPSAEIAELDAEVKDHDPLSALDGGEDGMLHYRKIAEAAYNFLRPGGLILLEGGLNQDKEIADIFTAAGFMCQNILKDFGGINRCVILKK